MAEISVERLDGDAFRVTVTDARSTTAHTVTASNDVIDALGGGAPERLIEASFRFMLDREPKESILSRFDLMIIGRYFSDFPASLSEYLDDE